MPEVLNAREVGRDGLRAVNIGRNGPNGVYVGCPSKWGNPFVIGQHGTRDQVVERYRRWLWEHPTLMGELGELEGQDLICWCAPEACHADVLLQMANRT